MKWLEMTSICASTHQKLLQMSVISRRETAMRACKKRWPWYDDEARLSGSTFNLSSRGMKSVSDLLMFQNKATDHPQCARINAVDHYNYS